MHRVKRLNLINESHLDLVTRELRANGYRDYCLDGEGIHDKRSFLDSAMSNLPIERQEFPMLSWDSFADLLWQGIFALERPKLGIVWTHAENMLNGSLDALITALEVITAVVEEISSKEKVLPHTQVVIFL